MTTTQTTYLGTYRLTQDKVQSTEVHHKLLEKQTILTLKSSNEDLPLSSEIKTMEAVFNHPICSERINQLEQTGSQQTTSQISRRFFKHHKETPADKMQTYLIRRVHSLNS